MKPYSKKQRQKYKDKKKTLKRVLRKSKKNKKKDLKGGEGTNIFNRAGTSVMTAFKDKKYLSIFSGTPLKQDNYNTNESKFTEQAIKNDEIARKRANTALDTATNIGMASAAINVVIPFFAMSGVGLPLVGVLLLCKRMAELYQEHIQLKVMFADLILILENSYNLYNLITFTDSKFKEKLRTRPMIGGESENKSYLEQRLIAKLGLLKKLIIKISPSGAIDCLEKLDTQTDSIKTSSNKTESKSYLSNFKSGIKKYTKIINRFFYSEYHKNYIIKELTLINSLFIFMNSQFDWRLKQYESMINNPIEVNKIWSSIFKEKQYNDYVINGNVSFENIVNLIKDGGQTENIKKEVSNDVTAVIKADVNNDNNIITEQNSI